MTASDSDLLQAFAKAHSQAAFNQLVQRHLDLVYSAALRQVRSSHLAEEIVQSVFADLAHAAGQLKPDTILGAWLHAVTRRTAVDVIRKETRRQWREQIATELNAMNTADAAWTDLEPLLDEAVATLDEPDRAAVVLRYFENKSLREVGQQLGVSDDTAQKRVSRAVEKLRAFFSQRKVSVSASSLVLLLSANAVQSAPAGLAATISAATFAGAAIPAATLVATTKTLLMTTFQKSLIAAVVTVLAGAGIYEARQSARLRDQLEELRQQQAPLTAEIQQLRLERDAASNRLAAVASETASAKPAPKPSELLKLRGEVGSLRQANKMAGEKSALNKITSNPESRKAMRETQKLGMNALFGELAKRLNLSSEQSGKFSDLLADNVMDNVDLITQALHDGKSQAEVERIFADADTAFQGKVQALLGDEGLTQYKDYNQNLLSTLIATQFANSLTGDAAAKQDKQNRLQQLMQEQTATALKAAGLPANYQVLPILNFANIASETEANQNLALLDGIYAGVAANSSTFLTPDEIASFQNLRTNSVNNCRSALSLNRNLMAPISQ